MQLVNKYMLAVAIVWSLFTLFGVLLLINPLNRRLREWDFKRKPGSRLPTYPQRVVFLLLTLMMMAVSFATAFERDLASTIGINSREAWKWMMILSVLYFVLGWRKQKRS